MPKPRVGIVGVGYEGFRPVVSDLSTRELMFEAASKAYDDAEIEPRKEVGSFVCCTEDLWEGWSITDEMVPDQIAAAGRPLCTIPADGVTGLGTAVMQVLAGVADVVVLEAHSKAADVLDRDAVETFAQEPSLIRPLGMDSDNIAALEMGAFLAADPRGSRHLDGVIADSKRRATRNPRASYSGSFSRSDIEGSEMLSTPLRKIDRAEYAEAGVVLVLASDTWIRQNRREAVYVDGVAWNSSLPWFDGGDASTAEYARRAYFEATRRAGIEPGLEGFDVLELDDAYSYKLLQHLRSISKDYAEEERVLSGDGPALNPSGGSLGVGNLLEASALHRLLEVVLQLRGEAGAIQVSGVKRALVQSWRGVPTATGGVAVLSR
jgi:acetyl-CoA C-acetyltransferase